MKFFKTVLAMTTFLSISTAFAGDGSFVKLVLDKLEDKGVKSFQTIQFMSAETIGKSLKVTYRRTYVVSVSDLCSYLAVVENKCLYNKCEMKITNKLEKICAVIPPKPIPPILGEPPRIEE
jgi:hypothetical protein